MARDTEELRPFLEKTTAIIMREPISVETQLATTFDYSANEGRFRKVANSFGLGKSTVASIITEVCQVIRTQTMEEVEYLSSLFFKVHNFPQCVGAINGTQIPTKQSSDK